MPVEFADHVRLMFDLLTVAFQTDMTRIATFMIWLARAARARIARSAFRMRTTR